MNKCSFFCAILICALNACTKEEAAWNAQEEVLLPESPKRLSFVENDSCYVENVAQVLKLKVDCNIDYSVEVLGDTSDWIECTTGVDYGNWDITVENGAVLGKNDLLTLKISENTTDRQRCGGVVICNEAFKLADTLFVVQSVRKEFYSDGSYIQLLHGNNRDTNLVIVGDGFIKEDLLVGGVYENVLLQAADHFFSIEPYKSYRNYFNVYAVIAESEEAGVGEKDSWKKIKNKFGAVFGSGTEINCNDDLVFEYARKVKELPLDKPLIVIVVLNSSKYAGTTYLYSNGNSIALCPMSNEPSPNDFEGLIHHEAGGHGFGFLCDEYVYHQKTIPESRKQEIKEWQKYGFQMNLDFTDDTSVILWKEFIGKDKYSQVGAYEGGYEYQYGVWRSEENSCMNNNIPYFNVQSRWIIVNRIMKLSEKEFTVQDFIKADNPILPDAVTRSVAERDFRPLANPIWIN